MIYEKNKLMKQINYMLKFSKDFTYTSYDVINENSKIINIRVHGNANYKDLLRSNYIGLSTVVFSKNLFKMKFLYLKHKRILVYGLVF